MQPDAAMLILECLKYKSTLWRILVYMCVDPNLRENTRDAIVDHIEYLGWYQRQNLNIGGMYQKVDFCLVGVN